MQCYDFIACDWNEDPVPGGWGVGEVRGWGGYQFQLHLFCRTESEDSLTLVI